MIVCSVLLASIIVVALLVLPYFVIREAMREREVEDHLSL